MQGNDATNDNGKLSIGYKNASLSISSKQLLMTIIVLGLFMLLAMLLWQVSKVFAYEMQAVRSEHSAIKAEQARMADVLKEHSESLLYMISLPEAQRPQLMMPEALARRLRP